MIKLGLLPIIGHDGILGWEGGELAKIKNHDSRRINRQILARDYSANTHRQKSSSIPIES